MRSSNERRGTNNKGNEALMNVYIPSPALLIH